MADQNNKAWWQSKAVWTAIAGVVVTIGMSLGLITQEQAAAAGGILISLFGVFLRLGVGVPIEGSEQPQQTDAIK